ncbi:TonB family protein [Motilimonas cestriensis]|uniref:energy transducer TonB n=1 Tax=Motilimonas cestriensis TaxID=2742685 RepID=UPI003DA1D5E3
MRFVLALIGAPIMAFALFVFMAGLIHKDLGSLPKSQDTPYLDLVMTDTEEQSERKTRQKPTPPEVKPLAPQVPVQQLKPATPNPVAAKLTAPALSLSSSVSAMAINMPSVMAESVSAPVAAPAVASNGDAMAVPLHRVEPMYPAKAKRRGKEGYVVVAYDISAEGKAINVRIIEAVPKRTFEKAVKKVMRRWRFKPLIVDGKAQIQTQQQQRFEFKLES